MKSSRRISLALFAAAAVWVAPIMAQTSIGQVQDGAAKLADALATSLPFNSTIGLNWSDAYIGQIIALPPHFGVGIVGGATTIDAKDITSVLTDLGYAEISGLGDVLPIPAMAVEGRIGGFILPFDHGLRGRLYTGSPRYRHIRFSRRSHSRLPSGWRGCTLCPHEGELLAA
ncbi:hypothetical protein MASR2M78_32280 [Treponema sp.]